MNRLLILFTNSFPYNTSEPFLEAEYPLYSDYYDKVLIVAACKRNEQITRNINGDCTEIIEDYTLSKDWRSIIEAIPYVITDRMFYQELINLIFTEKFNVKKLYNLIVFSLCGNHRAMQVKRWLHNNPGFSAEALYAYWLHIPAYAALRLKGMLKEHPYAVSRAHGYDLYLERHDTGYIPFHRQMYEKLDAIASISKQGKQYLRQKYGTAGKACVYQLGAADRKLHNPYVERTVLRLVSCARSVSLKRLDRIVDALAQITEIPVEWTHIGDGPVQQKLKRYAKEQLPGNVTAIFTGNIPNERVYDIYSQKPFHVFVNVSETEGVPVSIMEAMSFDIPVIGTDVGGTAELVDAATGYLLQKDFSNAELASKFRGFFEMPEKEYLQMRRAARAKFERDYCAETNYVKFLSNLQRKSLFASDDV